MLFTAAGDYVTTKTKSTHTVMLFTAAGDYVTTKTKSTHTVMLFTAAGAGKLASVTGNHVKRSWFKDSKC